MNLRQSCRGRRGRAILAWSAGVFAVAQLVSGLLLDYVCPEVRSEMLARIDRTLCADPRGPDLVFLGSSRTAAGLYSGAVRRALREQFGDAAPRSVLNLALPAGDPISDELVLQHILRQGARPQLVVLEVAPDLVNANNPNIRTHIFRQMRWNDVPTYLPEAYQFGECGGLASNRLFPLFVFRREIRRVLTTTPEPPVDGEEEMAPEWEQILCSTHRDDEPAAVEKSRTGAEILRERFVKYHIGGMTDAALERVLICCRERNIAVLLLGVPVTSPLRELSTPEIAEVYRAYMEKLCRTYKCHFEDWADRLPDSDFTDVYHCNHAGGLHLSRQLALEVLAPLWRDTHRLAGYVASRTPER
jgi:hypothetical protein